MTTLERNAIPPGLAKTDSAIDWRLVEKTISVRINCSTLPNIPDEESIYNYPSVKQIIQALPYMGRPAVYWFTMTSYHGCKQVNDAMLEARKKVHRSFSFQTTSIHATKVLYVGKVTSDIRGRIITHLGYSVRSENLGLQLCYWAKALGLKLGLTCIILRPEAQKDLLMWEKEMAKALRPLIGKH